MNPPSTPPRSAFVNFGKNNLSRQLDPKKHRGKNFDKLPKELQGIEVFNVKEMINRLPKRTGPRMQLPPVSEENQKRYNEITKRQAALPPFTKEEIEEHERQAYAQGFVPRSAIVREYQQKMGWIPKKRKSRKTRKQRKQRKNRKSTRKSRN